MSLTSESVSEAWLLGISQEHLDSRRNGFGNGRAQIVEHDAVDEEFGDPTLIRPTEVVDGMLEMYAAAQEGALARMVGSTSVAEVVAFKAGTPDSAPAAHHLRAVAS